MTHFAQSSSGDGLIDTKRAGAATPVTVDMTTLDSWWVSEKKPNIGVVKIDTEAQNCGFCEVLKSFWREINQLFSLKLKQKICKYIHILEMIF